MAAHDRARLRPRGRADPRRRRPGPAGRGGGPGRDLWFVRGVRGRRSARRRPARGAAGCGGDRTAGRRRAGEGLMRLHRLRLAAFGPYAAEQVIDFDRLAHGGLFLLEGPTGAGKSTILDAVTFALFGGLAGADSADDRLRSHFAAPDTRTEVALEFSLRGVRHQVTRGPEYRRPKKRGEGFTTEASRVHLQRWDAERWTSVSSNKAEAGDAIKEAVGLTREQFTQVMLLPQGEFAKFLHSTDDVRRGLLTKLFGTGLYDRITGELATRRTEATRARDRAGRAIAEAVSAAAEAAGLGAEERADLLAAAPAGRQARLNELDESLAQTVASTAAALQAAAEEVTRAAA